MAEALTTTDRLETLADIAQRTQLSRSRTDVTATVFADVGGLVIDADGHVNVVGNLDAAVSRATELVRERRAIERSRTETMGTYAEIASCRCKFVLEHFGAHADRPCEHCDNNKQAAFAIPRTF